MRSQSRKHQVQVAVVVHVKWQLCKSHYYDYSVCCLGCVLSSCLHWTLHSLTSKPVFSRHPTDPVTCYHYNKFLFYLNQLEFILLCFCFVLFFQSRIPDGLILAQRKGFQVKVPQENEAIENLGLVICSGFGKGHENLINIQLCYS